MGRRFLSLGRSRCRSGGAKNNCRAKRKFYRGRHFRLLVRWGGSCSASGRIDVRANDVAHGMGWRTRSRTGRDTKAPGSIPAGGKQVRKCASSQSGSLLPYSRRAILWMDPAARGTGCAHARRRGDRMKRRGFISLVGATMVASKQGEGKVNRIALAGLLLILALPAAAEPDAPGCFVRTYHRAHLAQHPDQVVTAVMLRIHRPPPGNADKYWFLAQFALRGKDKPLRTSGICNETASGLRCLVECDGGGVDVVPRARDATM